MPTKPTEKIVARIVFDTGGESKIITLTEEELSILSSALWGYQVLPDLDERDSARRRHRRDVAGILVFLLDRLAGQEIARGNHWEPEA